MNEQKKPEQLWWEQTFGPSNLIAQITETAMCEHAVSFCHKRSLPWEFCFQSLVEDELRAVSGGMLMPEHWSPVPGGEKAAEQLINAFYQPDWMTSSVYYLPSMDAAAFLTQHRVLAGRAVWIQTGDPAMAAELMHLLAQFRRLASDDCGLLILELSGAAAQQRDMQTLLADTSDYDLFFFANLLASYSSLNSFRKRYASALAIELSFEDAERCSALMDGGMALLRAPQEYCTARVGGQHAEQLGHAVWKAQLNTLFSGIEDARLRMIDSCRPQLSAVLPFRDEFNNTVTIPEEFELRHLIFLQHIHKLSLPIQTVSTLELLHEARNALAHLHILSFEDVEKVAKMI